MAITDAREVFQPFEYPEAYDYWLKQQQAHWLHTEISMAQDIHDWSQELTNTERNVVGNVLKGFIQTEIIVNDYWSTRVAKWFPKPEIAMMASCFGNMETIHAKAYAYLNETLGLEDYDAFLYEPTAKAKLDNLVDVKVKRKRDIARSLAIFSGFAEGISLYSSFAILMHFSRYNKLKGVGQIVAFSVKDESLHSEAGCWLFRQFIKENPDLMDKDLEQEIYDAARTTIQLEDDFIDKVFELGAIADFEPKDLKHYLRHRANTKLGDLGLAPNWRNIDNDRVSALDWFDYLTVGQEHQDFFAQRVTGYAKGAVAWDQIFSDFDKKAS